MKALTSRAFRLVLLCGALAFWLVSCEAASTPTTGTPAATPTTTPQQAGVGPVVGASPSPTATTVPASAQGQATAVNFGLGARIPEPDMWNPYIPAVFILQGMNQVLMEPLFILNYETGEIDDWLAAGFQSNEALTEWTITLKEGAQWSDGQPVTADDLAFTVQMLLDNAPKLNWSVSMQRWVNSVEKVDNRTVKFTLKEPNPRFVLENFAGTTSQALVPLPKHVWEGQDPVTFRNATTGGQGWPVFSGAFRVQRFSETEFVYERNDDWWGAKTGFRSLPAPRQARWTWIPNPETTNALLINNQLDYGGAPNLQTLELLRARNPKLIPWSDQPPFAWRDPCPRMLTINHTVAPWGDKEMRWALNHAINRDQIVSVVWEGATVPASFIFPDYPAMMPYIEAIKDITDRVIDYDLDKMDQILQRKGYRKGPDGVYASGNTRLSLDVVAPPFMRDVAVIVTEQLGLAGIDAALRIQEWGLFRDQVGRGRFQATTDWSGCGSTVEPWFGMNRYSKEWVRPVGEPQTEYVDNPSNGGRWVNDQYSEIMERMGRLPLGDPQVTELLRQAVQIWVDELPAIPLIQQPALLVFNTTNWTNWPTRDNNYIHPALWWSLTHRVMTEIRPAR